MDVSGEQFASQVMQSSPYAVVNPMGQPLNSYSDLEFTNPTYHTGGSPISQMVSAQSYEKPGNRREFIAGWKLDKDLSTAESAIYRDRVRGRTIIGNRGTTTKADWITNGLLTSGTLNKSPRYKRTQKTYNAMTQKYKTDKYYSTGHSMGGSLSAELMAENKNLSHSTGFNGASAWHSPTTSYWINNPKTKRIDNGHLAYLNSHDIVSQFYPSHHRNIKWSKKHSYNPLVNHDLDQWRTWVN